MADSVEAVIAAMYLDGGIECSKKFIINNLKEIIEIATHNIGQKDYKTVLQEILQKDGNVEIEYKIIKEVGPDHDKTFYSEIVFNQNILAIGKGKSKKLADIDSARLALESMKKE